MKEVKSSTGGTITYTRTGLIHRSGRADSGRMAQIESKEKRAKQQS